MFIVVWRIEGFPRGEEGFELGNSVQMLQGFEVLGRRLQTSSIDFVSFDEFFLSCFLLFSKANFHALKGGKMGTICFIKIALSSVPLHDHCLHRSSSSLVCSRQHSGGMDAQGRSRLRL